MPIQSTTFIELGCGDVGTSPEICSVATKIPKRITFYELEKGVAPGDVLPKNVRPSPCSVTIGFRTDADIQRLISQLNALMEK